VAAIKLRKRGSAARVNVAVTKLQKKVNAVVIKLRKRVSAEKANVAAIKPPKKVNVVQSDKI